MADFDYDGPAEGYPVDRRGPVRVRLAGDNAIDLMHVLDVLRDVFDVSDVSRVIERRFGDGYAVYCTVLRQTPLRGGRRR